MKPRPAPITKLCLSLFITALALTSAHPTTQAEDKTDCAVEYTRSACPGQEAESFKKCDGKKTCTKYLPADSAEKCQEAAVAACSNDRPNITQSKVIHASFKGKPIKTKAGQDDMCLDYAKRAAEFDQCPKK